MLSFLILSSFFLHIFAVTYDYGLIFDAGSSGTRMHIYKWEKRTTNDIKNPPNTIPETFKHESSKEKSHRGIATCTTQAQINDYLKPHIVWAKSKLALESQRWKDFNIYFGATAGLRLLDENFRINLLKWVRNFLSNPNENPFKFEKTQATILSGEEEGIFGWLTVNLALGTLKPDSTQQTAGAIDMGGGSMQITFEAKPSSDILEDLTVIKLFGKTRRLYSHSFLEFGAKNAEDRANMYAFREGMIDHNPCYNTGYQTNFPFPSYNPNKPSTGSTVMRGEYDATECQRITRHMLWKNARCFYQNLCSINGVYQPSLDPNMQFYAFATFGFMIYDYEISGVDLKNPTSLRKIAQIRDEVCSKNWEQLKASKYKAILRFGDKVLANRCFITTYLIDVLATGFGFSMDSKEIKYGTSIKSKDGKKYKLNWATGAILYYSNLLPFEFVTKKPAAVIASSKKMHESTSSSVLFHSQIAFGLILGVSVLGFSIVSYQQSQKEEKYDQIGV